MTNFEWLKSLDIETFAEFLDNIACDDDTPWVKWFDENYCKKCESIKTVGNFLKVEMEFAPCELNENKCGMAEASPKELVKIWLEQEKKEEDRTIYV